MRKINTGNSIVGPNSRILSRLGIIVLFVIFGVTLQAQSPAGTHGTIYCNSTEQILAAMFTALPGDEIIIASGTYTAPGKTQAPDNRGKWARFVGSANGNESNPIIIRGASSSNRPVLQGPVGTYNGYTMRILGNYWVVKDLIITEGSKGVVFDNSNYSKIINVKIHNIGEEALHLRDGSSNCLVDNCEILNTGVTQAPYGEGIYVGSDKGQWDLTGTTTDYNPYCFDNTIQNCIIGPNVAAEGVDVKEGTKNTIIRDCEFSAEGISGENSADAFVDLKGAYAFVYNNTFNVDGSSILAAGIDILDRGTNENTGYRNAIFNNTYNLGAGNDDIPGVRFKQGDPLETHYWDNIRVPNSPEPVGYWTIDIATTCPTWNVVSCGGTTPVAVTGVTISATSAALEVGATKTLTATVAPSNATNKSVTWSSSNAAVATVNSSGLVTALSAGSATITVKSVDGNKTATCAVTVTSTPSEGITVESVDAQQSPNVAENLFDGNPDDASRWSAQVFPKSVVIDYGETKSITGTKVWTYQGRSYHYTIGVSNSPSSGFTTVVNQSGTAPTQPIVHSFAATSGRYLKLTVTGATGYTGNWVSLTELQIVEGGTTTIPVASVNLSPSSVSLLVGETQVLSATVSPSNATDKSVSYSSSNTSVATVNSLGVITAVNAGTATVTVKTVDGNKTATCAVTVTSEGGSDGCTFAPMATALPSINTSYTNIFVSGNGPNLSDISKFSINWSLANNGLYTFAFNTRSGSPAWYVNMKTKVSHTLNQANPALTVSGSGFAGFDGNYYAIMDGSNFVLAEKTGAYTIYFSTSATSPCDALKYATVGVNADFASEISLYPNPSNDSYVKINGLSAAPVEIRVFDMLGKVKVVSTISSNQPKLDVSSLKQGSYVVVIITETGKVTRLFNKL